MNKKVSIIVPVYGVEAWLERCLDSLVNQTLKDIEIIVVNDGSPDNSQEIIDRYTAKYPDKVFGYIKENGGLSDARNYGMQYATGEFLAFVDSDDYVDTTMYEKLYNKAMEEDSEIVVCAYYKVNDAKKNMKSAQIGNNKFYNASAKENKNLIEINAPYAWNKLVKKDLFDRTGLTFPKGLIFEDICTMYPLIASASKVSKVDEELYYYIVEREDSITATFNPKRIQMIDSLTLLCKRFKELGLFDEFRDQLVCLVLRHIYLRFKEFNRYKNRPYQLKLVNRSFSLLNKYFPNWRTDSGEYKYFTLAEDRNIKRWFYKRRPYWWMVSMMPLDWILDYQDWDYNNRHPQQVRKQYYAGLIRNTQIQKKTVLIESFHGRNISCSPYYIMKDLLKRGGYNIYVVSDKKNWQKNKEFIRKNNYDVTLVELTSKKYYRLLATAEYLINNVSFPVCFIRREGQVYLNTWHGTPLKTLGKNMCKGIESMFNIQHNFLQSSHLLFPNTYTKDCTMEDYNLTKLYTNETIVAGYPRNAIFSDTGAAAAVKEQLGLADKTVYVYMPTWRGINSYGNMKISDIETILEAFDNVLDEDHLLYVNLHPNVGTAVDYDVYKHVFPFPADIPNYEFVNAADALITDYSSIFFDYSITGKPLVLFMYDYDVYMEDRGMYLDITTLPFKKIYELEDMCESIRTGEILTYRYDDAKDYRQKFLSHDCINATEQLVDYIFDGKKGNLIVEDYSANADRDWNLCVQLHRIDSKEEFDALIQSFDAENTIFAVRSKFFHALMNKWFYEEYNDKLTYVVYQYCRMLTKEEEAVYETEDNAHKKERAALKRKAKKYGYMRTLPNINIINKDDITRII